MSQISLNVEQTERLVLTVNRLRQVRDRVHEIIPIRRPLTTIAKNMQVQSKVDSELDILVNKAGVEQWIKDKAKGMDIEKPKIPNKDG